MSTPLPVLNAFLDDDGRHLLVFEQELDGKVSKRRVLAEHVTWHRRGDLSDEMLRELKALDTVDSMSVDGDWVRLGWTGEIARRQGRHFMKDNDVDAFEGDVDPLLLWLVDEKVKIAAPRVCTLDLETDSRVPLARKVDARILVWSVTDVRTGQKFSSCLEEDTDDAETKLLEELMVLLDDYDMIAVWEGDWKDGEFDSVVLPARVQRRGLGVDMRRWAIINQLAIWRKMNMQTAESGAEKESFKLDDVAFEQIGKGKTRVPPFVLERFGAEKCKRGLGPISWDLWSEGGRYRKILRHYCERDSEILKLLEDKKTFLTIFQSLCDACGLTYSNRSLQPTRQMDGFILRIGRERGLRFPTKAFAEERGEELDQFRGAIVMSPKSVPGDEWTAEQARAWRESHGFKNGILRDVHVFDFKGMYPSMMRTYNLSSDVVAGWSHDGVVPPGTCRSPGTGLLTRTDELGIIPLALKVLTDLREYWSNLAKKLAPGSPEWRDAMAKSNAYKVAANSFYGGGGSEHSRFNNRDVSEATTQNCVFYLRLVVAEAEKRGMDVVYYDTDGASLIGPSMEGAKRFVKWLNEKKLAEVIASHGCVDNFVQIEFEKTFDRIIFTGKKGYVARYSHYKGTAAKGDSEPEIKGVAYKRGDRGRLARNLQGRIIDLLVGGVKVRESDGMKRPINRDLPPAVDRAYDPLVEGTGPSLPLSPTEDLAVYRSVIEAAKAHVLGDELPLEEVRLSMQLKKPLKEYMGDEAHVRVARVLAERGVKMSEGMRVEYVVVDGSKSPQVVIPADDYTGECDRFTLWEQAYSPTQALLEAAFPDEDWVSIGKARPPSPRGKAKKVPESQLGLGLDYGRAPTTALGGAPGAKSDDGYDEDLGVPGYSKKPLVVRVTEAQGEHGGLERLQKVFKKHPGARSVEIVIALVSGAEAVMRPKMLVSTSESFQHDVADAIRSR